ncbi:MAG TPA: 5-oxoprolinase [Halieaceae bacterium]|jgi:N-methylhydantoinase A|uniref:hydantoinase/oxoprolinase family protein n=1 Tax=Haliea TaxID=475794 RepID=UPI000C6A6347|nr:hydantoinase/oxoprolinase family protein [Haliea sp.]HAN69626.1 5-oxoprolinase [Halieaceae bacterium]MAD63228.1 5-oxoprolinase [Haliea sp.]MAY94160.1 5-oxoprolinase [Haliea sp.]MBK40095.1 5-oxoprolinase [Haliea sp.]MBP71318.1 5-oxoprolinase [Haliea sp.]|tara:strand:- start:20205 stop:22229 length:2025 start_codon:yes stop_codon:yes gene_type:complete
MTKYHVSADIGGTFTDIVIEPSDGPVFVNKVPTTRENPALGVINGIKDVVPDLADVEYFVHGTTVGLNAFLERRGERVLLVATAGAGDSYVIARGNRNALYDLRYSKPAQLVPRRDVHEVRGRLAWDGSEIEPLNEADFQPIIYKVKAEGINAVAVCLLHSYAYPAHEVRAREILKAALPGVSISLSHDVAREWREYERASSAVMNAYVAPVVERYLLSLQEQLRERGMQAGVHIMQSSGGVTTADTAREKPVFTLLSGPVGGTIAGASLAKRASRPNLLCVDMGGTSFDLSLVVDGEASTTLETELEGLPLLMSIVDIQTIGTGGGSVAWLDNDAVRVGPRSAGSVPGPACYGNGGTEPTVTDANLYLGRLGAKSLLSGEMSLDTAAAATAIESLAQRAGMEPVVFAEGILAISNAAMADAMRTITVSEGVDPRDFTLVAFGGAGPMAAVFLAEELDIREVLIPRFPGTFSAWGMLQTDLRHDLTLSFFRPSTGVSAEELEGLFAELATEGREAVMEDGISGDRVSFLRSADMRYSGQEYTINIALPSELDIDALSTRFHETHKQRHGHSSPGAPIEFVNLRLAAIGAIGKYDEHPHKVTGDGSDAVTGQREAVFRGATLGTQVLRRDRLPVGYQAFGPAIIEEQSATTVLPDGWQLWVDEESNLILTRGTAA